MASKTTHMIGAAALGIALCAAALTACSPDEEAAPLAPEAEASLGISLGTAAGTLTRADGDAPEGGYDGDPLAREHEFINSLWVFAVDEGGTVRARWTLDEGMAAYDLEYKEIEKDDEGKFNEPKGNIIRWIGPVKDLPAGRYTLYAFANLEPYFSDTWKSVVPATGKALFHVSEPRLSGTRNNAVPDSAAAMPSLESIVLADNPADKLDFESYYIPMSGSREITLTHKDQEERVYMDRLFSRVDVTVENQKAEAVTFKDFTMGGFAEQVGLMQLVQGTVTEFNHEIRKSFEGDGWAVQPGTPTPSDGFSLYVPETAGNNINQYVEMETTDGKTYRGLLKTSGIQRNRVLPLNLILHDDTYELTIHAYVAPIGGYPAEVPLGSPSLTEGYKVTLPEGCSFRITAKKKTDGGGTETEEDCPLTVTDQTNAVIAVIAEDGGTWGHVTALPGQEGVVSVGMPQSTVSYSVTITTEALKDWASRYNRHGIIRKP